ncbi:MarR family transcriptional regulator [Bacillus sp. FJAT-27231]|uniref:MarR family winged helix-turn-helix transcriptional regulator n=1 Tax=Bacillus sp. FJAT-27231 TaxID=1679168 RepID=UPI0006713F17|nr:MarR family transcriptional regulator [Bacillus sp. FJAT-27231]KMY52695.1 MarR family transcriptional regulator [Bacillus sp. FJAT-27231]
MKKQLREAVELFEEVIIYGTERVIKSVDNPLWREYSPEQMQSLKIINKHGPIALGQLAAMQGVHKSAISHRLKQLDENGLIRTVKAEGDQRTKLVELTEEGRVIVEQSDKVLYDYIEQLLSDEVEEQEIEQFVKTFRKLKDVLKVKGV